ncbi:MAG: lipoprotein [Gammaproteobacteria bacterium]
MNNVNIFLSLFLLIFLIGCGVKGPLIF